MKRLVISSLILGVALFWVANSQASHTDHGCHNCHVPHKALEDSDADGIWGVPLYSPAVVADGLPTFDLYESTTGTMDATVDQPDGASKLCLGCHDGSYFVFGFLGHGRVFANENATDGGMSLKTSHPVSFVYDTALSNTDGSLNDPATFVLTSGTRAGKTIEAGLLDNRGKLQCSSCHDVHNSGIGEETQLRWDIEADGDGPMCQSCHTK